MSKLAAVLAAVALLVPLSITQPTLAGNQQPEWLCTWIPPLCMG